MEIQLIDISELHPHPSNSNVMPDDLLNKLADHLKSSDRYPPLIVRPMPGQPVGEGRGYQILDGHHRVKALKQIDRTQARCVVWEVDDKEALLLLATLNRLQGKDDVRRRASLIAELNHQVGMDRLSQQLPEDLNGLNHFLALHDPPRRPRVPLPLENMPMAVYFFLVPEQRKQLDGCLKSLGGSREQALMRLVVRMSSSTAG